MKVLVIGAKGSMGRRYCAILRYLGEEVIEYDIATMRFPIIEGAVHKDSYDKTIIATPTKNHSKVAALVIQQGKDFLCEKPISCDYTEIEYLIRLCEKYKIDARMVSNWKFAVNRALLVHGETANMGEMDIEYNYYNSGKDGFFWDCIQPIYMAGRFRYDHTAPAFSCKVNGIPVTLDDFSHSYPIMVSEWLYGDRGRLWGLTDALRATQKVEQVIRDGHSEDKGEIEFNDSYPSP